MQKHLRILQLHSNQLLAVMTTNSTAPNRLQWYDVSLLRVICPCQMSPLCYNSGVHWNCIHGNCVLAFVTNRLRCATISYWILHQKRLWSEILHAATRQTLQVVVSIATVQLRPNEAMPTAIGDNISVPIISTSL